VARTREEQITTYEQASNGGAAADRPGVHASRGVYGISVAAELVGMGVQTLRLYEARGLLEPERTAGRTRRYSPDDIDRLRHIGELLEAGVNLAGIGMVLELEAELAAVRRQLQRKRRS